MLPFQCFCLPVPAGSEYQPRFIPAGGGRVLDGEGIGDGWLVR
jgi:hypothetical protein